MEDFLEILKFTIPSIIVFLTVFLVMRNYLNNKLRTEAMHLQASHQKETLPLRIQAYERLMLFCERISIDQLIYRLRQSDMSVKDLRTSLMIAIQQEFEHNLSQQIYVSDTMWQILVLAKNETLNTIVNVSEGFKDDEDSLNYSNQLFAQQGTSKMTINKAKEGLRSEIKLLF